MNSAKRTRIFMGMLSFFFVMDAYSYAEVETRSLQNGLTEDRSMQFVESPDNRTNAGSMGVGTVDPNRLESLQAEIQELRGKIEEQDRLLQQFTKTQKQLYLELSRRLGGKDAKALEESMANAEMSNSAADTTDEDSFSISSAHKHSSYVEDKDNKTVNAEFLYQAGYQLLKDKKYSEAEQQFTDLIRNYPKDNYSASAYYWLGEIKMLDGNQQAAEREFKTLIDEFPSHKRSADALLKLGMIAVDTKRTLEAKNYFQKVIHDFPESPAAQVADKQLKRLSPVA